MGAIYNNSTQGFAFDRAIQVGLNQAGNTRITLEESDGTTFQATGAIDGNPKTTTELGWGRTNGGGGSSVLLANTTANWMEVESSGDQEAGQLLVEIDNGSGTFIDFLLLDGGDFPQSVQTGSNVTIDPGFLDAQLEGIAELLLDGDDNTSYEYLLLDGNGSVLPGSPGGRLQPGDPGHSPFGYQASGTLLDASGDVVFENDSTSTWNVEELRVVFESDDSLIVLSDTGISATVAVGGSITFTTVEQDIQGLT